MSLWAISVETQSAPSKVRPHPNVPEKGSGLTENVGPTDGAAPVSIFLMQSVRSRGSGVSVTSLFDATMME